MVVWGGTAIDYIQFYLTGGRYNPSTNNWTSTHPLACHRPEFIILPCGPGMK